MTENTSSTINTPRHLSSLQVEDQSKLISDKHPKQSGYSLASTEIHSTKKITIDEISTPKKKAKSKLEAIKTFCRIRPTKSPNELFSISKSDDRILNINSTNLEKLNVGNNLKLINSYKFSKVFDQNSTQEEVFEYTCKPLLDDLVLNQKSGLVFTYGMTNAGKTYTVIGTPECPGILPLALKNLFDYGNINNNNYNFYCNFVEIYNEDVFDLLSDDPSGKNKYFKKKLTIKENLNSVFFLQDVTFSKLDTLDSFNTILNKGISKKVHSCTALNQNSSRSHTIFKIIMIKDGYKDISKIDFSTEELISLSVVDLAGSERQKRTDAKGKNLQEACKINQSLSTLGKCLEAMKHNSCSNINPRTEDFEESIRALNYSCIAKDIKPMKSVIPKLTSGNELKQQIKKERKLNEVQSNNNLNDKKNNDDINTEYNLTEKNNLLGKNDPKLNDSLTLNLNELFNSNSNFDDINEHEMKTEFTKAPEDISTKEEIAKLVNEIKKLREEVSEFKNDNSEFQKSKIFGLQSESQSVKGISFDKNKLNFMNNNLRPFSQISQSETNLKILGNNDLNLPGFNCNDSVLSQEQNNNASFAPLNNIPNNNILTPYGNYGYPFNNPFIPYYGTSNMFGGTMLPLPSSISPENDKKNKNIGKKGKKNKKMNDMINSTLGNIVPGISKGVNLIFINSKFGNLIPGQSILEESMEYSDSDDDDVPKKKKVKGTPKKKKKKNKSRTQKAYPKIKNRPRYPKIRYDEDTIEEEDSLANNIDNENNDNHDNALNEYNK